MPNSLLTIHSYLTNADKSLFHFIAAASVALTLTVPIARSQDAPRERISLDDGWRFQKGDPADAAGTLDYPKIKDWVMATGGELKKDAGAAKRPEGTLGADISFVKADFDDSGWRQLNLPHDWGVEGPFDQALPGETGKLPWSGVGWYRKHLTIPANDQGKQIYLDIDGAMSYSTVWLNGQFVGGWPYGYSSYRVDLTPYIKTGETNQLAIRLDNPPNSSRWYPGGGIYRNVWLVKTSPVHVAHWGTYVTTPEISAEAATVNIQVTVENETAADSAVTV